MADTVSKLIFSCFVLSAPAPAPGPAAVNYCENSFCPAGVKNIGCDPPPITGGSGCTDFKIIDLGQAEQAMIVDYFNGRRNFYASGARSPTFPQAQRMLKLTWDAELAQQANYKSRTCSSVTDDCRNTAKYSNVGQFTNELGLGEDTTEAYLQMLLFTASIINYTKTQAPSDWSNILNDKAVAVGCALSVYTDEGVSWKLFVCNFSDGGIVGSNVYVAGPTASLCTTGTDQFFSNLCSSAEVL
ncbi:AGAP006417-PA-like protein [Anopheles sinensis]|uniref:AGAP006417-PA-like protein n=1 Tax=Anopheles sinensis TaxID=74873 RepID=A0A084VRL1_ANOSI|nr:AGAP006417-PA-like protein [Anopheles sinensis]